MPQYELIAEFPGDGIETSLEALEATARCVVSRKHEGRPILLSAQSFENDGEIYICFDGSCVDGVFRFDFDVPEANALSDSLGIAAERIRVSDEWRKISIENASVAELTGLLDHLYREVCKVKLVPGEDSYNFVAEVEIAS